MMELVYHVGPQEKLVLHSVGHSDSSRICSCWSKNNLLAYTWEKVVHGFIERYISILDPNQPWNVQNIPLGSLSVTCLQWNETGLKLLYATSSGLCAVWGSSENLTNLWKERPVLNSDLHNEVILAAAWLSVGRNVQFNPDKPREMRDGEPKDKLSRSNQAPTLMQVGGQTMEGYVVLTPSGILAVKCLTTIQQPVSAKTQLKNVFTSLRVADIAFNIKGNIIVMASNGNIQSPVQFWSVKITYNDDALRLSFEVDVMPSITMECISKGISCPYITISHLNFVSRPSSDHVIICASHSSGSIIEAWLFKEHKESPQDLHPVFLSQSVMEEKIKRWKKVMTSHDLPKIIHLSLPPVSVAYLKIVSDINLLNILGICIVCPNNVIKFLHKVTLGEMYSHQIPENILSNTNSHVGNKRSYTDDIISNINHVELSPMSCALSVFDNRGNILLYKVAPWFAKGNTSQMAIHSLVQMLCFCAWNGRERWDILLHIDNTFVNHICEQLRHEFYSNNNEIQEMYSIRLLSTELSIYQRCSRFAEATDCYLRLMFKTISVVFRSLLKPPHNSHDEQAPVDKLHEACSTSFETDITRFLQSVDTDQKILQSLQQLIQYVADVALYLVTLLPQIKSGIPNIPGASLLRDRQFLENLRELLVIIQMWKLLKAACAPTFFSLDDNSDWLPIVFKSLTEWLRLVSSAEFKGHNIPDNVIEDSRALCDKIIVPAIDVISPVNGILQRMKSKRPLQFEFGRQPHTIRMSNNFINMNRVRVDDCAKIDHLRRIHLGVSPTTQWKTCSRCGIVSLLHCTQGSALETWEKRFSYYCICGGSWHVKGSSVKK